MRTPSHIPYKDTTEKLEDFISRIRELVSGKTDVEVSWPRCEDCDQRIWQIYIDWDQTEEEKIAQEIYLKDCERASREWDLKHLAELKAKYETTS